MNRVIAWFQKAYLQQMVVTFLVGVTWLVSLAVWQYDLPAQAAPITPEAGYQVNQPREQIRARSEQEQKAGNGLAESVRDTTENVREKLNLDQPLPESTKDFLKQVQGEDVTVEEPRPFGK